MYYDNIEERENIILRTVTCIILSETNTEQLIEQLPKDLEGLTIIQGYDSGNKTIKFQDLDIFSDLFMLTLKGAHPLNSNLSKLICDIDKILKLKYLELEKVLLKSSVKLSNGNEIDKVTFEYVRSFDTNAHPLTLVRKGIQDKILPYKQFKEQEDDERMPVFVGFDSLILLRISGCNLNRIEWQMFEGLQNLLYLILEDNHLKLIPDFAFYGVPNIKTLSLAKNQLLNLQITDLAGLLELEYLDLSYNNFSQLSELSLPPFPKLKLANFRNNPITVVFPNTFEVLNTTESIILGSEDTLLSLLTDSFTGLNNLRKLVLNNLKISIFKREILTGITNLKELILTGSIPELEYDAFVEVNMIEKLVLKNCNIQTISMDAFLGLSKLKILDLSKNLLEYLAPGIFDDLVSLQELYLNNNKFTKLPKDIFNLIHPKLLRLNDNPWHCTCDMSTWKPMIVNRIKQKTFKKKCEHDFDKGLSCKSQTHIYKYTYENRVAPRCSTPRRYKNWSVFHSMRKGLKCPQFKPKYKKSVKPITKVNDQKKVNEENNRKEKVEYKMRTNKYDIFKQTNAKALRFSNDYNTIKSNHLKSSSLANQINYGLKYKPSYKNQSKHGNKANFDNDI